MADRVSLNLNTRALRLAALPLTDAQRAGHDNPLAFVDAVRDIVREVSEAGHSEPIGLSVRPFLRVSVETTMRRGQAER